MKVNSTIMLELNKTQSELLKEQYSRILAKIIASQLSLKEINELVENLMNSDFLLIKNKQSEFTEQIL